MPSHNYVPNKPLIVKFGIKTIVSMGEKRYQSQSFRLAITVTFPAGFTKIKVIA